MRTYKYRVIATLLFLLALPLFHYNLYAGSKKEKHVVLKMGYFEFPPFMEDDYEGKPSGFAVEILERLFYGSDTSFIYVKTSVKNMKNDLDARRIDLFLGDFYSMARDTSLAFSDILIYSNDAILSARNAEIKSISDLKGKILGQIGDDDAYNLFHTLHNSFFGVVIPPRKLYSSLLHNKCDGIMVNRQTAYYFFEKGRKEGNPMRVLEIPFQPRMFSFIFRKEKSKICNAINRRISNMRLEGVIKSISRRWLTPPSEYYKSMKVRDTIKIIEAVIFLLILIPCVILILKSIRLHNKFKLNYLIENLVERHMNPVLVIKYDKELNILYQNEASLKMTGVGYALIARTSEGQNYIARFMANLQNAIRTETAFSKYDYISKPDGSISDHYYFLQPLEYEGQKVVFASFMPIDEGITADRITEESIRVKYMFLKNLSEEIIGPVNLISDYAISIASAGCNENAEEADRIRDLSSNIIKNGEILITFIDGVINLTMSDFSPDAIKNNWFSLNKLLHDLEVKYSKILSVIGKSDDVKINLSLPESDYNCFIDELNLRNIFDNMLGNSCRFTKEGSIDISYFYDGRFHFTISDTGPGINLYDQHFMFMPGREFKGYPRSAGLGMYIIHKIIENMNGKISFESEEGMGTTFFIDIQAPCKEVR